MKRSPDERHKKKKHTETSQIDFNTHGGLPQLEGNKCM